jgi:hypothetical protein
MYLEVLKKSTKTRQNGRCHVSTSTQPPPQYTSEASPFEQTVSSVGKHILTLPSTDVNVVSVGIAVSHNNQTIQQRAQGAFPGIPHASLWNSFGITCQRLPFPTPRPDSVPHTHTHTHTHTCTRPARQRNCHNTRILRIRRAETKCRREQAWRERILFF